MLRFKDYAFNEKLLSFIEVQEHYAIFHSNSGAGTTVVPIENEEERKELESIMASYDGAEHIRIKYHTDAIEKIEKIEKGDWIDLRAAKRYELKQGEFAYIDLGVSMEIPKGYEAHLLPRSSTFKKWGIIQTNSIGIIDNSYNGDNDIWMMPVLAMRDTVIEVNDRICQFRIMENQPKVVFDKVDKLDNEDRGGFGSTGKA